MDLPQNSTYLVVTNPLHYTYLQGRKNILALGSAHNILLNESATQLGFNDIGILPAGNSIEELIHAHQNVTPDAGASYISWKAFTSPFKRIGNSYELAHQLEEKSRIRSILPAELFPDFFVVTSEELIGLEYDEALSRLSSRELVLQSSFSTGGKGTYFVSDVASYETARKSAISDNQDVVVSKKVVGISRAIQCLLVAGEVFHMGWWHRDLVGVTGVCAVDEPSATKYCGAIVENIDEASQPHIDALVDQVGERLKELGYSGVFGMDVVVEEATGKVYLIEINPRLTAVSHLYATIMHAYGYSSDFITTSVINDLGEEDAYLTEYNKKIALTTPYYYLKLQNIDDAPRILADDCKLGVYQAGSYVGFGFGVDQLKDDQSVVVVPEGSRSKIYKAGDRMFSIIGSGDPMIKGRLSLETVNMIDELRDKFTKIETE